MSERSENLETGVRIRLEKKVYLLGTNMTEMARAFGELADFVDAANALDVHVDVRA